MKIPILLASLFLFALACGDDVSIPGMTGRSNEECPEGYDEIGLAHKDPYSEGREYQGSGVLEQRVLEKELVIWAEVLGVEGKVVEKDSIEFELKGDSDVYKDYSYILFHEVKLQVSEYLKGEGPDLITAVVESQLAFNSREEGDCAASKLAAEVRAELNPVFDSDAGIAFLDSTNDPDLHYMGLAYENFSNYSGFQSTWLPTDHGGFPGAVVDWTTGDHGSIDDVRKRVSYVLEEYNRRDDEAWGECLFNRYFEEGTDPWAYQGVLLPYDFYRDHTFIFNGEHVPVPAGTMIRGWSNYYGDESSIILSLEGKHADLFEIAYHSEYEYTANGWVGISGSRGHQLAIWYKPREGRVEQWQSTDTGHVITVVEDLEEGEYEFILRIESEDIVDCGQSRFEPREFRVIVDKERVTTPPAPTNVQVVMDSEGWTITWGPRFGVDYNWVKVYRLEGDEERIDVNLEFDPDPEDSQHFIRFADMKGCGDVIYIEIWPKGDGTTYLRDFGEPSEPVKFEAEPCESK